MKVDIFSGIEVIFTKKKPFADRFLSFVSGKSKVLLFATAV